MKKNYEAPEMETVPLMSAEMLEETSYIDTGGESDNPDAKERLTDFADGVLW